MTIGYEPNLALGPTYKGFAGPKPERTPREQLTRKMVIGGVASALVLGLAVGLWAKPEYRIYERKPMAPVTGQVDIVVDTPPPSAQAQPVSQGRLEVLPPDMAAAAQSKSIRVASAPPREAALPPPVLMPAVDNLAPVATPRPAPRPVAATAPRVAPRPLPLPAQEDDLIDCRNPANGEEAGICRDIAASDRADGPPAGEDFEARFDE